MMARLAHVRFRAWPPQRSEQIWQSGVSDVWIARITWAWGTYENLDVGVLFEGVNGICTLLFLHLSSSGVVEERDTLSLEDSTKNAIQFDPLDEDCIMLSAS